MQYPMIYAGFRVLIASAVIVLGWLTLKKDGQKIKDLPVLATCQSRISAMFFGEVKGAVVHGSTRPIFFFSGPSLHMAYYRTP